MKTKPSQIILLLFSLPLLLSAFSVWAIEKLTSTLADQTALELTVYNSNLGLVKDLRQLPLPRGPQELKFMDVVIKVVEPLPGDWKVLEHSHPYRKMD